MNENHRKNIGVWSFWVLIVLLMSVIGSSFACFGTTDKQITLETVNILSDEIKVLDESGNQISALKFKMPKSGLKPVTGELDEITKIPYTISCEVGSEGAYSVFYVECMTPYKIEIENIQFSKGEKERKEVYVNLKEEKHNESVSLEKDNVILFKNENPDTINKHTMLVWLSSFVDKELIGAKISFNIKVSLI